MWIVEPCHQGRLLTLGSGLETSCEVTAEQNWGTSHLPTTTGGVTYAA